MKSIFVVATSFAAIVFTGGALAQQSTPPPKAGGSGLQMPYERGFWGNAGLSFGRSKLHAPCPGGTNCDLRDGTWRAHAGGRFNNVFGAEIGWVDLGDFGRGGGQTSASGLDLKAVAGFPIGENSSVFGKLGAAYLRSNVSGAGLATGRENGWQPTFGIGAQFGLTKNWAIRGDIDRYRVSLPGGSKDNVDTYMLGAQYSFQ